MMPGLAGERRRGTVALGRADRRPPEPGDVGHGDEELAGGGHVLADADRAPGLTVGEQLVAEAFEITDVLAGPCGHEHDLDRASPGDGARRARRRSSRERGPAHQVQHPSDLLPDDHGG